MPDFKTLYPDAKVLVVDDDSRLLTSLSAFLDEAGYREIRILKESRRTMEVLKEDDYSCVLLDLFMPDMPGLKLLPRINKSFPKIPVVVFTGNGTLKTAVSCMRLGAYDYLAKPFAPSQLLSTLEKAVQRKILQEKNLKRGLSRKGTQDPEVFHGMISSHPMMKSIFTYMETIAKSPHPALITGESGTGKELVAKGLYNLCGNYGKFIAINVSELDDGLFSDALFGHTRGAFTGAERERAGLIGEAEDGVLFLDEIGTLNPASQIKLLRLLQEREYRSLGSDKICGTNTRFIVATNRDLEGEVKKGKFREDLFFRLNIHAIHVPPLRERLCDLPILVNHFINKHAKLLNKRVPGFPPQLLDFLKYYRFPGNVRELENMIINAVVCSDNNILPLNTFQRAIEYQHPKKGELITRRVTDNCKTIPTLKETANAHIEYVVRHTNDNLTVAAKILGMTYNTLHRRLRRKELKTGNDKRPFQQDLFKD